MLKHLLRAHLEHIVRINLIVLIRVKEYGETTGCCIFDTVKLLFGVVGCLDTTFAGSAQELLLLLFFCWRRSLA